MTSSSPNLVQRRFLPVLPLLLAAALFTAGHSAVDAAPKPRRITGKVVLGPGDTPVKGAVVTAIHLISGTTHSSAPTAADGRFEVSGLPFGYYEFAVDSETVLHAISGVALLEPGKDKNFDLRLIPQDPARAVAPVMIAALSRQGTGGGEIIGLTYEPPFFKTPAGVATIVGASALLLLLL